MDRVVAKFSSFQEAERADREYYRSLTPQQRLDLLLELNEAFRKEGDAASERLERVYRITELSQS